VVVAAVIYNLPRFFERRLSFVTCDGISIPQTEKTDLHRNRDYFLVYKTICYFVFRAVGPLVALIVLNSELMRALRTVRRRRRRLLVQKPNARGSGSENLTLMLVTVVTVFIVCQLPNLGIRIAMTLYHFAPRVVPQPNLAQLRYANVASNALLTLNSAVNFAIYCLVGKKFRRIFVREVATCNGRLQSSSGIDDGESATLRQASPVNPAGPGGGRCPSVNIDATQMTEIGLQRSPRFCRRMQSAVSRRCQLLTL